MEAINHNIFFKARDGGKKEWPKFIRFLMSVVNSNQNIRRGSDSKVTFYDVQTESVIFAEKKRSSTPYDYK